MKASGCECRLPPSHFGDSRSSLVSIIMTPDSRQRFPELQIVKRCSETFSEIVSENAGDGPESLCRVMGLRL